MKRALPALLLAASPALAGDLRLIRFDDPGTNFASALGRQVDVRFSGSFAAAHFAQSDFDAVIVSELPEGKVCFFGRDQGLDPNDPRLVDLARPEQGDVCVPRGEVAVRYAPREGRAGGPPAPFHATDKRDCIWVWKTGGGIGVWTEECAFRNGRWSVAYDAANDRFALSVDGGDPYPVLRQFRKKPEEGPQALLPGLRTAGLVAADADCRFAPYTEQKAPPGWALWEVAPTGKLKEAFEALPDDEVPEPPCGELGFAVDHIGYFMIADAHPERVLYVDLGQDGTMFDPSTITFD